MIEQWAREWPGLDVSPIGVIGRISRLSRELEARLEPVYRAHGLEHGWHDVLATLRRSGPPYRLRASDFTRTLMITSSGATKRLDRLERARPDRAEPRPHRPPRHADRPHPRRPRADRRRHRGAPRERAQPARRPRPRGAGAARRPAPQAPARATRSPDVAVTPVAGELAGQVQRDTVDRQHVDRALLVRRHDHARRRQRRQPAAPRPPAAPAYRRAASSVAPSAPRS